MLDILGGPLTWRRKTDESAELLVDSPSKQQLWRLSLESTVRETLLFARQANSRLRKLKHLFKKSQGYMRNF